MKRVVLAISGSLRKTSLTDRMLDLCIEGMGQAVEVHKFRPHQMTIGPCTSCWSCWSRNRLGQCVQRDDFEQILDVYKRADYILVAAPLYFFDLPATVKNVIDRFFVVLESAQVPSATGGTEHPTRFARQRKAVLISSCGFPEIENLDLLSRHFRLICQHLGWTWAGQILVSAAGAANAPKLFDRKYEHIREAGRALIDGEIPPALSEAIAAPVMPVEDYRKMASLWFAGGVAAKVKVAAIAMKAARGRKEET